MPGILKIGHYNARMSDFEILSELARRLRQFREAAGYSLVEVAQRSGLSRRYLTEAEAGRGNLSILKLARLSQALKVPLKDLCDIDLGRHLVRRVALVGLRGAGKTTIGRRLALELEMPFVELDHEITEKAGLSLEEIFSMHGEAYYRRMEREALEEHLEKMGASVLATGGSLVTQAETYDRLRGTCFTVWLKADPEDHWQRTIRQGDLRPMRRHPDAMRELRAILSTRESLYAKADLAIDTSVVGVEDAVKTVIAALR